MMQEIALLLAGVTIVFGNRVSLPRERGLHYFERDILLLYEYTQNGEFLTRLATRVVQAQANLARRGYRTGGAAPYGFTRVLVDAQGNEVQELPEKTTIRREGCHVSIKPKDPEKIQTWIYILHLYGEKRWGMLRIVLHLNRLGIPAPNAGRQRRVNGRLRTNSGQWSLRTVAHLISNAAIVGLAEYGKKSGGKHRRLGPDGPRTLTQADRRADGAAKLVFNPKEKLIRATAPAGYDAPANQELFDACQAIRDERGQNRRGIARCPDRSKYPLATRVFDLTDSCGAVLYGRTARKRPGYLCSRYMRSGGHDCHYHGVDAEATLAFVLDVLKQRVQMCGGREALRQRLLERATGGVQPQSNALSNELALTERHLAGLESELKTIGRNLARAADDAIFAVVQGEYRDKQAEVERARQQVERLRTQEVTAPVLTPEGEVDAAMQLFDEIERVATDPTARAEIPQLLGKLNLNLGLRFVETEKGGRTARVVQSGILTMGAGPHPRSLLQGSGDSPPDAEDGDGDSVSPPLEDSLPTVNHQMRHQGNGCFTIGKHGEPGASATGELTAPGGLSCTH